MSAARRLTAVAAAERLQVKRATLYSYVSRGLISRHFEDGKSTFDRADIERLARTSRRVSNKSQRRSSDPIFVTELTLFEAGRVYYRGLDVIELSRTRSFEDVAEWLWTGLADPATADGVESTRSLTRGSLPWQAPEPLKTATAKLSSVLDENAGQIERFALAVAAAGATDELRYDLSPVAVRITARSLITLMVDSLARVGNKRVSEKASIAERLWPRLTALPPTAERIAALNAALIIMADHELAASTLAARVAAAFRANPYAVVGTGLGPTNGLYHGANASEVESLFHDAFSGGLTRAIGRRLKATGRIEGFGQELYPRGDPRGAELLMRVSSLAAVPERTRIVDQMLGIAKERGFAPPSAEFGLGALSFVAEMVPGSSQAIATLARTVGWIAHALEEYARSTTFRVRAVYLGPRPLSEDVKHFQSSLPSARARMSAERTQ